MKALKSLFVPRQPTIGAKHSTQVSYEEFTPSQKLQNHIFCYWQLKSKTFLKEPFYYRVVSDGCVDILADVKKGEVFVTGFSKRYVEFNLGKSFEYIGIRFYPFMFPLLFGISARQVVDKFLKLDFLIPKLSFNIRSHLTMDANLDTLKLALNNILEAYLSQKNEVSAFDQRFSSAVDQILISGGNIPIHHLDIALSQRQLRRFFEFYFGESPKMFSKVFRFQNILNAKPSIQSLKSEKVFYDKGYYDQAHFIRDFKRFYGVTPSVAFGRE